MTTKDLINAIADKDSAGIESAFNSAMAERISAKLDVMRQDVAQNMFKEQPAVETVAEPAVE